MLQHFLLASTLVVSAMAAGHNAHYFERVTTWNICEKLDASCNVDNETLAEIVDASPDGMMLCYTDGALQEIGFLDITDATAPSHAFSVALSGEPTSVAFTADGRHAIAAVNTSPDFVNVTGELAVIEIASQAIIATIPLPGQPDSIKINGTTLAVAIENERDEDLGDGEPPQMPPGYLVVMDISSDDPTTWEVNVIDLLGLNIAFPEDPEPEFVDINAAGLIIMTLQENNGLVLVDTTTNEVVASASAGTVDLDMIDLTEEDVILQTESKTGIPREPDAVVWITETMFATADEGDLFGGSRGFTIFDSTDMSVVYTSGVELEHAVTRIGHYPESRSGNKGNEPEGLAFGVFDDIPLLFVLSERSNVVGVYDVSDPTAPVRRQILPTSTGPEGAVAIPSRDLFVVATEVDARGDKIRAGISIYQFMEEEVPSYPSVVSVDRENGSPIPFSALSGLACGESPVLSAKLENKLFTVEDSYYDKSRMFVIDVSSFPYTLESEYRIMDSNGLLGAVEATVPLVNDDMTVNLDLEGIARSEQGGFWLVSEGRGTVGDEARPVEFPNLLLKVDDEGVITQVVMLPDEVNAIQLRFGFEGVAEDGSMVVVAFQRAWNSEEKPRLGIYNTETGEWDFVYYPLEAVESQNGGWVGLSDVTAIGGGNFLVLERDNQGGPDAAIKKVFEISLADYESGATVSKTLVMDLMPLLATTGGNIYEKVEGLCATAAGTLYMNNDNDGVDDNSGESTLFKITDASFTVVPTIGGPEVSKCVRRRRN